MTRETWTDELADYERLYRIDQNGLYVWAALRLTANTDLGIPGWCQQYLADSAQKIHGIVVGAVIGAIFSAPGIWYLLVGFGFLPDDIHWD